MSFSIPQAMRKGISLSKDLSRIWGMCVVQSLFGGCTVQG